MAVDLILGIGVVIAFSLILMYIIDEFHYTTFVFCSTLTTGWLVYSGLLPAWSLYLMITLTALVGYGEFKSNNGGKN